MEPVLSKEAACAAAPIGKQAKSAARASTAVGDIVEQLTSFCRVVVGSILRGQVGMALR
jgi:hypothetical protein